MPCPRLLGAFHYVCVCMCVCVHWISVLFHVQQSVPKSLWHWAIIRLLEPTLPTDRETQNYMGISILGGATLNQRLIGCSYSDALTPFQYLCEMSPIWSPELSCGMETLFLYVALCLISYCCLAFFLLNLILSTLLFVFLGTFPQ